MTYAEPTSTSAKTIITLTGPLVFKDSGLGWYTPKEPTLSERRERFRTFLRDDKRRPR